MKKYKRQKRALRFPEKPISKKTVRYYQKRFRKKGNFQLQWVIQEHEVTYTVTLMNYYYDGAYYRLIVTADTFSGANPAGNVVRAERWFANFEMALTFFSYLHKNLTAFVTMEQL